MILFFENYQFIQIFEKKWNDELFHFEMFSCF